MVYLRSPLFIMLDFQKALLHVLLLRLFLLLFSVEATGNNEVGEVDNWTSVPPGFHPR
jgi:hypothetical protein